MGNFPDRMPRTAHRRTLLLFGVLAAYVLLQFLWWAYLLVEKDNELQALIGQLDAVGVTTTQDLDRPARTLWMVTGEGFVFVALLLAALGVTYRSVQHELSLARAQRNFLLATSHELRTPIAGIKLHLQTLRRHALDDARRETLMQAALSDVERLGALSEKILLVTRLDESGVPMHLAPVDLAQLLNGIVQQARSSYGSGHVIECTAPGHLVLNSDADALRSIFGNLLENACKYAAAGSGIQVTCTPHPGHVEVAVADEGPGIRAEDRDRIFERFYRGGSEETRQVKGTGLGLYIVDRLARMLGGRVELRPRAPQGSIFAVQLPLR